MPPVIALSGRRIDAPQQEVARFPLERAPLVKASLKEFFVERRASALVCSAACGADLLALDVAGELGLRRRVVLPFERERFRETSVIDRPGDWGGLYDRIIDQVEAAGDLLVHEAGEGDSAYAAILEVILDEALELARAESGVEVSEAGTSGHDVLAVVVWDRKPRGDGDVSEAFGRLARRRGVPLIEILSTAADDRL